MHRSNFILSSNRPPSIAWLCSRSHARRSLVIALSHHIVDGRQPWFALGSRRSTRMLTANVMDCKPFPALLIGLRNEICERAVSVLDTSKGDCYTWILSEHSQTTPDARAVTRSAVQRQAPTFHGCYHPGLHFKHQQRVIFLFFVIHLPDYPDCSPPMNVSGISPVICIHTLFHSGPTPTPSPTWT